VVDEKRAENINSMCYIYFLFGLGYANLMGVTPFLIVKIKVTSFTSWLWYAVGPYWHTFGGIGPRAWSGIKHPST